MSARKNHCEDKVKKPELFGVKLIGEWEKANLIGLVNGSPSPTAIGAHHVKLYKGGIVEYQLPVRDGTGFTTLFTDLRCWLVQPVME